MPIASTKLPLVILPGIDGTRPPRGALLESLERHRPVHLIDYPLSAPADYEGLYRHILPRLPEGRFVVLGESYGGPLATIVAARLPERVAGLILAVTFVTPPLPSPFRAMTRWIGIGIVPQTIVEHILLNEQPGEARSLLRHAIASVPNTLMTARAVSALSCDMRTELSAAKCPVLALEAKRDRLVFGHCSRAIARARPNRRLVLIDGPHMILETHVDACAQVIESFCTEAEVQ